MAAFAMYLDLGMVLSRNAYCFETTIRRLMQVYYIEYFRVYCPPAWQIAVIIYNRLVLTSHSKDNCENHQPPVYTDELDLLKIRKLIVTGENPDTVRIMA